MRFVLLLLSLDTEPTKLDSANDQLGLDPNGMQTPQQSKEHSKGSDWGFGEAKNAACFFVLQEKN